MPFVTLPLHVITVYLKGDPHHIAHQIPLEAVPTWDVSMCLSVNTPSADIFEDT